MPRSGIPAVRPGLLLCAGRNDRLGDRVGITVHLVVPEAKHAKAFCCENSLPRPVPESMSVPRVLTAIDFHDHPRLETREVDDETADRHLPAEVQALLAQRSQPEPQLRFLTGQALAKAPRRRDGRCGLGPSPSLAHLVRRWLHNLLRMKDGAGAPDPTPTLP